MNFRDKINQNIKTAPTKAEQERREQLQKSADSVCKFVMNKIEWAAESYKTPNIPFKMNMMLVCPYFRNICQIEEGLRQRGWFQVYTQVNQMIRNPESIELEELIRKKLKPEGITVRKGVLYDAVRLPDSDYDVCRPCDHYFPRDFELIQPNRIELKQKFNIDPTKPITQTIIENHGWGSVTTTKYYSQGNINCKYESNYLLALVIPIEF